MRAGSDVARAPSRFGFTLSYIELPRVRRLFHMSTLARVADAHEDRELIYDSIDTAAAGFTKAATAPMAA